MAASALERGKTLPSFTRSPYPVNRAVRGLRGNAAWLISNSAATTVRNGILMHTGAWANYSDWRPPMPMPNSLGCIHAWCVCGWMAGPWFHLRGSRWIAFAPTVPFTSPLPAQARVD